MSYFVVGELQPRPTRFPEIGYVKQDKNLWRFVAMDHKPYQVVGPQYRTKAELFGDLERYAKESWGLS